MSEEQRRCFCRRSEKEKCFAMFCCFAQNQKEEKSAMRLVEHGSRINENKKWLFDFLAQDRCKLKWLEQHRERLNKCRDKWNQVNRVAQSDFVMLYCHEPKRSWNLKARSLPIEIFRILKSSSIDPNVPARTTPPSTLFRRSSAPEPKTWVFVSNWKFFGRRHYVVITKTGVVDPSGMVHKRINRHISKGFRPHWHPWAPCKAPTSKNQPHATGSHRILELIEAGSDPGKAFGSPKGTLCLSGVKKW